MFDIGGSELLVIGVVALIVVGPKDLPGMFRALGRITAKARGMAREFSRAMEDAAKDSGISDVAGDLKGMTSKKSLGLDALEGAAERFEKWEPKLPGKSTAAKPDPEAVPPAGESAAAAASVVETPPSIMPVMSPPLAPISTTAPAAAALAADLDAAELEVEPALPKTAKAPRKKDAKAEQAPAPKKAVAKIAKPEPAKKTTKVRAKTPAEQGATTVTKPVTKPAKPTAKPAAKPAAKPSKPATAKAAKAVQNNTSVAEGEA
jgi:sec-independent protein translocase protein TatB